MAKEVRFSLNLSRKLFKSIKEISDSLTIPMTSLIKIAIKDFIIKHRKEENLL